jgi:hypothetical protein
MANKNQIFHLTFSIACMIFLTSQVVILLFYSFCAILSPLPNPSCRKKASIVAIFAFNMLCFGVNLLDLCLCSPFYHGNQNIVMSVLLGFISSRSLHPFECIMVIGLLMTHNIINWKYHINCLIMKYGILNTWVDCICKIF